MIIAEISGGEYCFPRMSTRTSPFGPATTLYGTIVSSSLTSASFRPMNRLIENTVFSGFMTACRFATVPTRRSLESVNATTEGVVRPPSAFSSTVASPPSSTATHELVVPRSIPIVFATYVLLLLDCTRNLSVRLAGVSEDPSAPVRFAPHDVFNARGWRGGRRRGDTDRGRAARSPRRAILHRCEGKSHELGRQPAPWPLDASREIGPYGLMYAALSATNWATALACAPWRMPFGIRPPMPLCTAFRTRDCFAFTVWAVFGPVARSWSRFGP